MSEKILLAAKIAAPGAISIETAAHIVCGDDHEKELIINALRALLGVSSVSRAAGTTN